MIQKFVDKFITNKGVFNTLVSSNLPRTYKEIVELATRIAINDGSNGKSNEVMEVTSDDGGFQSGDNTYLIFEGTYPRWVVRVSYGSCSGCDAMQAIEDETSMTEKGPTTRQMKMVYQLALHIVQAIKPLDLNVVSRSSESSEDNLLGLEIEQVYLCK